MKVTTLVTGVMLILAILVNAAVGQRPVASAAGEKDEMWLSPVNTGDCVAPRISMRRTTFVAALAKKNCFKNNPDEAKAKKCIENSNAQDQFSFFTDRCSEEEYFIGINGKEVRLRKTSKRQQPPHDFIGSFVGEGYRVEIRNSRPLVNIPDNEDRRSEDDPGGGAYEVRIVVKYGAIRKTFKGTLMYGL